MSEPDKPPQLDYESPPQPEPADDFWGVGPSGRKEPLNYESRVENRPLSIMPDPRSSMPFLKGILFGTPTTLVAMMITFNILQPLLAQFPQMHAYTRSGFMTPSAVQAFGTIIVDSILKIGIGITLSRTPYRADFAAGLLLSIFTSYGSCCGLTALFARMTGR